MVTTSVYLASSCILGMWCFLEKAFRADVGIRLAELEQPTLKKFRIFVRAGSRFMFTPFFIGL